MKRLWPDCPNELVRDDTILIVRAGYAIKHGRLPAPEEFGVRPLDRLAFERLRESPRRSAIERERAFVRDDEPLGCEASPRSPRAFRQGLVLRLTR